MYNIYELMAVSTLLQGATKLIYEHKCKVTKSIS
jgi:hypothetical protein